jgi:effector-binding domain-containing protein
MEGGGYEGVRVVKHILVYILFYFTMGVSATMAIEEAAYEVIVEDEPFELRVYEPHILAEVEVSGSLEEAGNRAFRPLFRYISGHNTSRGKIEMTAPVSQSASGEKLAMTAPVGQQKRGDKWVVSFMMPASYSMETLPKPKDSDVKLRAVPARQMAVIRYSGTWSEKRYKAHKEKLQDWLEEQGYEAKGDFEWARYNFPMTPWFMRRNEILIETQDSEKLSRNKD